MRALRRLLLLALCWLATAMPAVAETRVALVIGNSAYKQAPALANPKNDAEGVAESLKRLKFDVLAGTDLDKPAMERLLQAFSLKIETADVALVFYAGHGLQVNGRNYLVPIDAKLDREADLVFQAVPLDVIQGLMEQSQRTSILILDACRDNPLARSLARTMGTRSAAIGRGLGETTAGIGTLIVYATQPGNVALDGAGKNSPFTAALLANVETPGLEVRQVFTRVRQAVIQSTNGKQVPWDSSSLTGDWFFTAAPAPPSPGTMPPTSVDRAREARSRAQAAQLRAQDAKARAENAQGQSQSFAERARIAAVKARNGDNGYLVRLSDRGTRFEGEGDPANRELSYGVFYHANTDRYEGAFRRGDRHYYGIYVAANGVRIEGAWGDDTQPSLAVEVGPDSVVRYAGEWSARRYSGFGVRYWPGLGDDQGRYEGELAGSRPHGVGVFIFNDGRRYEGEVADGKMTGRGVLTDAAGKSRAGRWENDKFLGPE